MMFLHLKVFKLINFYFGALLKFRNSIERRMVLLPILNTFLAIFLGVLILSLIIVFDVFWVLIISF